MTPRIQELIDHIRSELEEMTPDIRLDVIGEILRGHCRDCGCETHGRVCHCTNDE